MTTTTEAPTAMVSALDAARRGWRVFPLPAGAKIDPEWTKRDNWIHRCTSDPATIMSWWADGPVRNYGIPAHLSGLLILDEDEHGALAGWEARHAPLPATFTVATAKGRHLYFLDGGNDYGNSSPFKREGINVDVRSPGYVVGPGSVHGKTGMVYTVTDDRDPAPVPAALHAYLTTPAERPAEQPATAPAVGPAAGTDPWLTASIQGALDDLAKMVALPEDAVDDRGRTWQTGAMFDRAARLIRLSNVDPSIYPLDQARRDYIDAAPAQHLTAFRHTFDDAAREVGAEPAKRPTRDDDRLTAEEARALLDGVQHVPAPPLATEEEPSPGSGSDTPEVSAFDRAVADEMRKQLIRDEARRLISHQQAAKSDLPPVARLDEFLAEPDPPITYRISKLWPAAGRVVFAAQQKAGKTTTIANVLRVLVDGGDLFDEFPAEPVRKVLLLDNELAPQTLRRWLRDQGIVNTDRVELLSMRGRLSTFNILEETTRARWAKHVAGADILLLDCLRPALDALGLDENHDAGRFLEAFDELITEAGIPEGMVVHHMGHSGERSRGDSRILDWPDAIWRLVREDTENPASARYFTAHGRDVDVRESRLAFDEFTRHLSIEGGSRTDRKTEAALDDILDYVTRSAAEGGPPSGRQIESELGSDHPRQAIRAAIKLGIGDDRLRVQEGPRRAKLYVLGSGPSPTSAPVRRSAPPVRQRAGVECASAPIEGALHSHSATPVSARPEKTSPAAPCESCGEPLPDSAVADGFTTHPSCEGAAA